MNTFFFIFVRLIFYDYKNGSFLKASELELDVPDENNLRYLPDVDHWNTYGKSVLDNMWGKVERSAKVYSA